jgi:hypothetical protein
MARFGLVTEGITDQKVLEGILIGLYGKNVETDPLQPTRDETNKNLATEAGNWHKVMEYCKSDKLKTALLQEDYLVIIQVDTDVLVTENVPQAYQISLHNEVGEELNVEETIEVVRQKLITLMSQEFYEANQHKIIFAIAVHSTECWLLPAYLENDKKKAGKLVNCLDELNKALIKGKEKFYINEKNPEYYEIMAKRYWKGKFLKKVYTYNPSLRLFVEDLEARDIQIEEL